MVSRPAQRSHCYGLHARQVAIATLYIRGFSSFVASAAAPIATGWSEPVPGRYTPAVDQRLCTAHLESYLEFVLRPCQRALVDHWPRPTRAIMAPFFTGVNRAEYQVETIRLRPLKIAAQVRITARKIWIRYSKAYPSKNAFLPAWAALRC